MNEIAQLARAQFNQQTVLNFLEFSSRILRQSSLLLPTTRNS